MDRSKWKPALKAHQIDIEQVEDYRILSISTSPRLDFEGGIRELVRLSLMTKVIPAIKVISNRQKDIYYLLNEIQGAMLDLADDILKDADEYNKRFRRMKSIGFIQGD